MTPTSPPPPTSHLWLQATAHLASLWGVSPRTVSRWRKQVGAPLPETLQEVHRKALKRRKRKPRTIYLTDQEAEQFRGEQGFNAGVRAALELEP